jgi:hypothetical protein
MPNRDKARTQLLLILDLLYTDRPPHSHRLQPAAPPEKWEGGAGRRKETLKVERAAWTAAPLVFLLWFGRNYIVM